MYQHAAAFAIFGEWSSTEWLSRCSLNVAQCHQKHEQRVQARKLHQRPGIYSFVAHTNVTRGSETRSKRNTIVAHRDCRQSSSFTRTCHTLTHATRGTSHITSICNWCAVLLWSLCRICYTHTHNTWKHILKKNPMYIATISYAQQRRCHRLRCVFSSFYDRDLAVMSQRCDRAMQSPILKACNLLLHFG